MSKKKKQERKEAILRLADDAAEDWLRFRETHPGLTATECYKIRWGLSSDPWDHILQRYDDALSFAKPHIEPEVYAYVALFNATLRLLRYEKMDAEDVITRLHDIIASNKAMQGQAPVPEVRA